MSLRLYQAVTPLHLGDGAAIGHVDLPIARERHTRWPTLPGSSLKGALRAHAALSHPEEVVHQAFGSAPGAQPLVQGTLQIGPAALLALALPCHELGFVLLTSPLALARLRRAAHLNLPLPSPRIDQALHPSHRGQLTVCDLTVSGRGSREAKAWATQLHHWSGGQVPTDQLLIAHDDVLSYACEAWTPVRTRNSVDPSAGVVRPGQLFTEEVLPPESLLWGWLSGEGPHSPLPPPHTLFAVGGHRTLGAGRLTWFPLEAP